MKPIYRLRLLVSLLILVFIFSGLTASSASGQSPASGSISQLDGQETR